MASRRRKILFRIAVALALFVLLLIVAVPLWLPWLLRPIAQSQGFHYESYERLGYGRFLLKGVAIPTKAGSFKAADAEAFTPAAWLWNLSKDKSPEPFLVVRSWEFTSAPANPPPPDAEPNSTYTNIARLDETLAKLRDWLPRAVLTNGVVRLPFGAITIPTATWSNGIAKAEVVLPGGHPLQLALSSTPAVTSLSIQSAAQSASADFRIALDSGLLAVDGTALWRSNRLELDAEFPASGVLPSQAHLRAPALDVPAQLIRLPQYSSVTGSVFAAWSTNQFSVDIDASAQPGSDTVPPLTVALHASGNTNRMRIDEAQITSSWLQARLSEGIELRRAPPFLSRPARLEVLAELAGQPWLAATGAVNGTAIVFPSSNRYPRITMSLSGDHVGLTNFEARSVQLEGEFDWPVITVNPARIRMTDGSDVLFRGAYSIATRSITNGELNYTGRFGNEFLPDGYSYLNATLEASFHGAITNLIHSGTAHLQGVRAPGLNPVELALGWEGAAADAINATIQGRAGHSEFEMRAGAEITSTEIAVEVSRLSLRAGTNAAFELDEPFQAVAGKSAAPHEEWKFRLPLVRWHGPSESVELEADVDWPRQGTFRVAARGLNSAMLTDFIETPDAQMRLSELQLAGGWTNGPVRFALHTDAVLTLKGATYTARAAIEGGEAIAVRELTVSGGTQAVVQIRGTLPIAYEPGAASLKIDPGGALGLTAQTDARSSFWDELAEASGVLLVQPEIRAEIDGTWSEPQGTLHADIARIRLPKITNAIPEITDVQLAVAVDREKLRLERFHGLVQGQAVEAAASLPLGQGIWTRLIRTRELPDWRVATGELRMEQAQLAAFSAFVPSLLAPQGRISVNLALEKGGDLRGNVTVDGAATRPLENVGPIRDIEAEAVLAGNAVELRRFSCAVGGQKVTADGRMELRDRFWERQSIPVFQLSLRGTNVPLVRKPDVVLRADLDLALTNQASGPGILQGAVRLRDSFFLSDLASLVPRGGTSPKRRPPYFSIDVQPWADWRLNLDVQGSEFLRVRTPLFRGAISTTMRVEGRLGNPVALGEVRISSGAITFPFGSFDVKQGFVSLTSADPYHPQLFVHAEAQRFGYDIRLDVTGPADAPVLQFASTPPLNSEQILLMLTTGQMPEGLTPTSTRQRAQGLALFMGKNILSELGIGGGEGRLSLRSGQDVTESGRPTYELEYKINEDWSVIGEYDRFSQYNLGLKWKLYSK